MDTLPPKKKPYEHYFTGFSVFVLIYRDNEQLSKYGDTKSARGIMLAELKKLIEANPLFRDKLQFPPLKNSRLRTLINQRYLGNDCLSFNFGLDVRVLLSLIHTRTYLCGYLFFLVAHSFFSIELQFKLAASTL